MGLDNICFCFCLNSPIVTTLSSYLEGYIRYDMVRYVAKRYVTVGSKFDRWEVFQLPFCFCNSFHETIHIDLPTYAMELCSSLRGVVIGLI